jgi:gluconolactonase
LLTSIHANPNLNAADGIQVDIQGNVWSCTGDGLYVWDPNGVLLMRVFISESCFNLSFVGKGRIVVTAQTRLYLIQLAPTVRGQLLDTYPQADKRIPLSF